MSKYPLDLIEKDFTIHRLTYTELMTKYHIPDKSILSYYSKKYGWQKKRKEFLHKIDKKVQDKIINERSSNVITERTRRIENFKKIVAKVQGIILNDDSVKVKSKETLANAIAETSKHLELLEGNATDRTELKPDERQDRLSRLKEHFANVN